MQWNFIMEHASGLKECSDIYISFPEVIEQPYKNEFNKFDELSSSAKLEYYALASTYGMFTLCAFVSKFTHNSDGTALVTLKITGEVKSHHYSQ